MHTCLEQILCVRALHPLLGHVEGLPVLGVLADLLVGGQSTKEKIGTAS